MVIGVGLFVLDSPETKINAFRLFSRMKRVRAFPFQPLSFFVAPTFPNVSTFTLSISTFNIDDCYACLSVAIPLNVLHYAQLFSLCVVRLEQVERRIKRYDISFERYLGGSR